jgi:(p)ppGpp synthase/HD superfamily hydrolase
MKERLAKKRKDYSVELVEAKPKVKQALAFARKAHEGQKRKYDGGDYIDHPIEVANILIKHGITDERTLIAAVLHDVIEDCHISADYIEQAYGKVTRLDLEALTVLKSEGNRKRRAELKISKPLSRGAVVVAVKVADIMSNISDVALHDPTFASVYIEEKKAALTAFRQTMLNGDDRYNKLIDAAFDTYSEALNQLALTVLAEENERVVDEAQSQAEIEAILFEQQIDELAELALF